MPTPLERWVDETAKLTRPKNIYWCDGSEAEYNRLVQEMLETGTLLELNQKEFPGCYLHRSDPSDSSQARHLDDLVELAKLIEWRAQRPARRDEPEQCE